MTANPQSSGPGRPRIRQRPDLRVTIRFRYHCDEDLIEVLEDVPDGDINEFIRTALREWLQENGPEAR
jgi:hypothetical protein